MSRNASADASDTTNRVSLTMAGCQKNEKGEIEMEYNKEELLQAIEVGELEVDFDNYDLNEYDGHIYVRHSVNFTSGDWTGYELEWGEVIDLYGLKEDLYEVSMMSDSDEQVRDERVRIEEEISGYMDGEHNDVFDYGSPASALYYGEYV